MSLSAPRSVISFALSRVIVELRATPSSVFSPTLLFIIISSSELITIVPSRSVLRIPPDKYSSSVFLLSASTITPAANTLEPPFKTIEFDASIRLLTYSNESLLKSISFELSVPFTFNLPSIFAVILFVLLIEAPLCISKPIPSLFLSAFKEIVPVDSKVPDIEIDLSAFISMLPSALSLSSEILSASLNNAADFILPSIVKLFACKITALSCATLITCASEAIIISPSAFSSTNLSA